MRTRWIAAAGLAAIGLVWVGQGIGLLRGSSFMVNDGRWAIAGVALLLIGGIVAWSAVRSRRQA